MEDMQPTPASSYFPSSGRIVEEQGDLSNSSIDGIELYEDQLDPPNITSQNSHGGLMPQEHVPQGRTDQSELQEKRKEVAGLPYYRSQNGEKSAIKQNEGWVKPCLLKKEKIAVLRDPYSNQDLFRYQDMDCLEDVDEDVYGLTQRKRRSKRERARGISRRKAYFCSDPRKIKFFSLEELQELQIMFRKGIYTIGEVCRRFQCCQTSAYSKMRLFKQSNGQLIQYYLDKNPEYLHSVGYLRDKAEKIADAVTEIVKHNPKLYIFEINHILQKEHGIETSDSTICKILRELRFVKKKPQRIYIESNTEANLHKRQQYCSLYLNLDPSRCIFIDQCGINNRINREKGWVRRGEPLHCEQPSDGANKYSLLAAMSFEKLHETHIKVGAINSKDMATFIQEQIADKYEQYVLILDNAKIHRTPEVRESLARNNIKYLFLPPYSPLLNPIENVFHEFKGLIRNLRAQNPTRLLKECIDQAVHVLRGREFVNYERKVRRWAEKGLRMEKFQGSNC